MQYNLVSKKAAILHCKIIYNSRTSLRACTPNMKSKRRELKTHKCIVKLQRADFFPFLVCSDEISDNFQLRILITQCQLKALKTSSKFREN